MVYYVLLSDRKTVNKVKTNQVTASGGREGGLAALIAPRTERGARRGLGAAETRWDGRRGNERRSPHFAIAQHRSLSLYYLSLSCAVKYVHHQVKGKEAQEHRHPRRVIRLKVKSAKCLP